MGCDFVVGGRVNAESGAFETADQMGLGASLPLNLGDLFVGLNEEEFRVDPDDGWADEEPGPGVRGRYRGPLDPQLRDCRRRKPELGGRLFGCERRRNGAHLTLRAEGRFLNKACSASRFTTVLVLPSSWMRNTGKFALHFVFSI